MRNIIIKISEIADGAEASVHPRSFYHGVGGSCYRSRPPAGTQHARGATSHGQSPLRTLKCQKRPTGMPGPRVCRDLYSETEVYGICRRERAEGHSGAPGPAPRGASELWYWWSLLPFEIGAKNRDPGSCCNCRELLRSSKCTRGSAQPKNLVRAARFVLTLLSF